MTTDGKQPPALTTKGTGQPGGCPGFLCASCAAEEPYGMPQQRSLRQQGSSMQQDSAGKLFPWVRL